METTTDYAHKQVRRLTDNQKVEIVLQKEIRPTATSTNKNIAQDFQVSEGLVDHLNYSALSPAQKTLYEKKIADLKVHALDLTYASLLKAKGLMNKDATLKDLPAIMGAAKIGNDIYRLETNQPTQIINEQNTDKVAQAFSNYLKRKRAENAPLPSDAELIAQMEAACIKNQADFDVVKARVLSAIDVE